MLMCNCSLAGTSACKNCNRYIEEFGYTGPNYMPTYIYKDSTYTNRETKKKHKPVVQYWCPECNAVLDKWDNFCHNCGIELYWEDFEENE